MIKELRFSDTELENAIRNNIGTFYVNWGDVSAYIPFARTFAMTILRMAGNEYISPRFLKLACKELGMLGSTGKPKAAAIRWAVRNL